MFMTTVNSLTVLQISPRQFVNLVAGARFHLLQNFARVLRGVVVSGLVNCICNRKARSRDSCHK
jgi:hypothetical protein